MANGKIKKVVSQGYGFISTSQGIDFFFHHTAFQGDWKNLLTRFVVIGTDRLGVEFDVDTQAPSGPRAINVRLNEAEQ